MFDLLRMRYLIRKAPKALMEIEVAEARATGGAVQYSDMPRGGGRGDKLERDTITLVEVKAAYAEIIHELTNMQNELRPYIEALQDPDQRAVMRLRYLCGHSPEVIADAELVPMARRTVYRCLRKAEDAVMLALNGT